MTFDLYVLVSGVTKARNNSIILGKQQFNLRTTNQLLKLK